VKPGRGFSVVAEEVQRLAERSADATRQISALVKAIQTDTQDAVAAMERSTQGVVEGARLSDNAGTALSEIDRVSRQLADLIEQISDSASQRSCLGQRGGRQYPAHLCGDRADRRRYTLHGESGARTVANGRRASRIGCAVQDRLISDSRPSPLTCGVRTKSCKSMKTAVDDQVRLPVWRIWVPLAWVLDELRKSLDVANKSLKRFVRDTLRLHAERTAASVDASQLRMARQHMHQAVGALEMVGSDAPAHMLRAMEAAVQQFRERPERCNEASAALLERASFALLEYLDVIMGGVQESAVGLFPQYRDAQVLAGAERIHPADLWPVEWRWIRPDVDLDGAVSLAGDGSDRGRMDQAVLRLMQKGDTTAGGGIA
jgi:hypothetical protein